MYFTCHLYKPPGFLYTTYVDPKAFYMPTLSTPGALACYLHDPKVFFHAAYGSTKKGILQSTYANANVFCMLPTYADAATRRWRLQTHGSHPPAANQFWKPMRATHDLRWLPDVTFDVALCLPILWDVNHCTALVTAHILRSATTPLNNGKVLAQEGPSFETQSFLLPRQNFSL